MSRTRAVALILAVWTLAGTLLALGIVLVNLGVESTGMAMMLVFIYGALIGCGAQALSQTVINRIDP